MRYNIKFAKILFVVLIIGIITGTAYVLFFKSNAIAPENIVKNINKVTDLINSLKSMLKVKSINIDNVDIYCNPVNSSNGIFNKFKASFETNYNNLKKTLNTLKSNLKSIDENPSIKNTISISIYDNLTNTIKNGDAEVNNINSLMNCDAICDTNTAELSSSNDKIVCKCKQGYKIQNPKFTDGKFVCVDTSHSTDIKNLISTYDSQKKDFLENINQNQLTFVTSDGCKEWEKTNQNVPC